MLQQPADLDKWTRDPHAELTGRLQGAAVIVFDLFFKQGAENGGADRAFAEAIDRAGNVLLIEDLETVAPGRTRRNPPHRMFADAALGTGDFVVPDIDGVRVMRYWTFGRARDGWPALPLVAAQVYFAAAYDDLVTALRELRPALAAGLPETHTKLLARKRVQEVMKAVRDSFVADVALRTELDAYSQRLPDARRAQFRALVDLYGSGHDRYLNFFGPPGTIRTLAYEDVVNDPTLDFTGQIVLVGLAGSFREEKTDDEHYTPFSSVTGDSLAGVEILATAIANLVDGSSIVALPLAGYRGVPLVAGLLLGLAFLRTYSRGGLYAGLLLSAGYVAFAIWQFSAHDRWWPLVIPIAVQLPLALGIAFALRYRLARDQRERMQIAFGHFLPAPLVERLSTETLAAVGSRELVHGTCLVTDAQGFTHVAETLQPQLLGALLDAYHETLFTVVTRHGGVVSDIGGDAMVAVWPSAKPDPQARARACKAAVELVAAVDAFNLRQGSSALPTRVGLESGSMLLGNVGAVQRLEFRAIGDIVNTASRIEGLNRALGTRALASSAAIADIAVAARDVGTFLLRGKAVPVTVHELREPGAAVDAAFDELFARALLAFRAGSWTEASALLESALAQSPNDGPARYYATLAESYRTAPPSRWAGAVEVAFK